VGTNKKGTTAMINTEKFNSIVEAAKAKTNDPKWTRAIEKAAKAILSGELIVTTLAHGALVTSSNGTYSANGHCNCEAARKGHSQCYHRAAARLMDLYETEMAQAVSFVADVIATPRRQLIVEIKACWPKSWPPLADELMRRFHCNRLDYLDDGALCAVRLAIAA
jgi:hypothetical protein